MRKAGDWVVPIESIISRNQRSIDSIELKLFAGIRIR